MSSIAFYDSAVPHVTAGLNALIHLLDKIEEHAANSSTSVDTLINARLAPDMHPLTFQVFVVCDAAMQIASRCQAIDPIVWESGPGELKTLQDLRKRANAARDFVQESDPQKFVDPELDVTFNMAPGKYITAKAREFVNGFALPNMYFHIITMYNILRSNRVPIGKVDYLDFFLGRYVPQALGVACNDGEKQ
ncbi:hypothetical protein B0T10DRAFT_532654 [Thelonectria olida]|uniref:DUF1993 domain-containing protein n=1 Tax=Thelonectria olida TaxID=1576542 RepID=A0A9P8VTR5_9HYPO|nr:hypothetical protein B0T10DRAFT_532654 [Thelonectria olida]